MAEFQILDHLEKLTPDGGSHTKKEGSYHCPACETSNFKVNLTNGFYQSFGCDCTKTEAGKARIRNAVSPARNPHEGTWQKPQRPKRDRTWEYCDAQGKPIIRTRRIDDGDGNRKIWQEYHHDGQWVSGGKLADDIKAPLKSGVMPYRWAEAKAAAAQGQKIFWVEGEPCADALWNIGLPAITTIGGADGYSKYGDYSGLLTDALVVVCPDRDAKGSTYGASIAADYPGAQWLYCEPDSAAWAKLPIDKGFDVADWIAAGATIADVLGAIGERRKEASSKASAPAPKSIGEVSDSIRRLLVGNLPAASLQAEKITLRSQTSISEREFGNLWNSVEAQLEEKETRDDRLAEVDKLLEFGRSDLNLAKLLPDSMLPKLLNRQSELLGSTEAAMMLTLLPVIATLAQVGTRLELIKATGFYALPILYTGICGESGTTKSPTTKTILKPLYRLQSEADLEHKSQILEYKQAKSNPENGEPLQEPIAREYYTSDVTREAVALIQSQQPGRGFLGYMDELSAVIGGQNQYRSGKGTDKEALLSGRDGTPIKVNRASGKRISTAGSAYSITGGTQPDTLRGLMGDFTDGSGQWARFLWTCLPIKPAIYPNPVDGNIAESIGEILYDVYRRIERFDPKTYTLSSEALTASRQWFEKLEDRRLAEPKQALRSVYAKAKGNVGEVALILHLLKAALAHEQPVDEVTLETFNAAIEVMVHCLRQVRVVHSWGAEADGDLAPALVRIIELSDRKGAIAARDVQAEVKALRKEKPAKIRELFTELAKLGKGEVEGSGIRLKFRSTNPTTSFVDPIVDQPDFVDPIVDQGSTATSQTGEQFQPFVDFVDQSGNKPDEVIQADSVTEADGFKVWDTVEVTPEKLPPQIVQAVRADPDDANLFGEVGQIEKIYSAKLHGIHSHYAATVRLSNEAIRDFPIDFLKRVEVACA